MSDLQAHVLTALELASLRQRRHATDLYAAIWPIFDGNWSGWQDGNFDAHVYTLVVNQTFPDADDSDMVYEITYDRGGLGAGVAADWNACRPDMLILIGTSEGAYDAGIARLRGFDYDGGSDEDSGTMYIGECSEIAWENNLYLTIVDEFGPWPRHLYIDSSGVVYVDRGFFYLDAATDDEWSEYAWSDGTYTDEHDEINPVPVMGPDAVIYERDGTISAINTVAARFDGSDSWTLGTAISSYRWVCPGASASADTATDHPTFTFDHAGVYRVELTVGDGTNFSRAYRHVFVYDQDNPPPTTLELQNCSGSRAAGGWSFTIQMLDEAARSEIMDRARCVLFAVDEYGYTEESIGPIYSADHAAVLRANIVSQGWIDGESIVRDSVHGLVKFTVEGLHTWLKAMTGFPHGIEDYPIAPTDWFEMEDLTVDRALWSFFYYRSTVTRTADVYLTGDPREISAFAAPTGSLWDQVQREAANALMASTCCDRYGRLMVEIPYNLLETADRAAASVGVMTLTALDWRDNIDIERDPVRGVAQVDASGVHYAGGAAEPYFMLGPGHVPSLYGGMKRQERLALWNTQAANNTMIGYLLGSLRNEYPDVDYKLRGNYRVLDICPLQYITQSLVAGDTQRGIVWTDKKLIPKDVSFLYDNQQRVLLVDCTAEGETFELNCVTGDPPPEPPDPPETPDLPPVPIPPPIELWTGPVKACYAWTQTELGYTSDLLLRHVDSTATAGTGILALFDDSIDDHEGQDFIDIGVQVGDYVQNLVTHITTTVAAVVSGTQLTLAADIGLGAASPYAIAGNSWHDATGGDLDPATTGEHIIQFVYINLGTGVAGWVLTDAAVYYAPDVLTAAPAWSEKLTLAAARVLCGPGASFQAISVSPANSALAAIAMDNVTYTAVTFVANGGVYTNDTGTSWNVSLYGPVDGVAPGRYSTMRGLATDPNSGDLYAVRGYSWPWSPPTGRKGIWKSSDGGATFTHVCAAWVWVSTNWATERAWIVPRGGQLYLEVDAPVPSGTPLGSADDGANWSSLQPAGYTGVLSGIVGHYAVAADAVCIMYRTADSEYTVMRSSDSGASWNELTDDLSTMFDEWIIEPIQPVMPDGWPWPPDPDILGVMNARSWQPGSAERKLFYSDDNGITWFNKTTDWVLNLGDYGQGAWGESCGFMPLPRVGINA